MVDCIIVVLNAEIKFSTPKGFELWSRPCRSKVNTTKLQVLFRGQVHRRYYSDVIHNFLDHETYFLWQSSLGVEGMLLVNAEQLRHQ